MPNDTDFTPFREAGLSGVNFAFIEDVHDYHTANDSLEDLVAVDDLEVEGGDVLALAAVVLDRLILDILELIFNLEISI